VKGGKKIYLENWSQKQAGIAILIPDKTDFKSKLAKRHKESHFILTKGTIHQEKWHIYTKCQCSQFHQKNTTGHKSTDRPQDNNSRWL
jgi:hypothetical protein